MSTPYVTLREASILSWKSISYLRKLCKEKILLTNPKGWPKIMILKSSLEDKFETSENMEITYKNEIKDLNKEIGRLKEKSEWYRISAIKYKEESIDNKLLLNINIEEKENIKNKLESKNRRYIYILFFVTLLLLFTLLISSNIININL